MLGRSPTCLQYVFALVLYDALTFKEMKIRGKIRHLCAMTFMELFRKKPVNALPLGWYMDYYCYHCYYNYYIYHLCTCFSKFLFEDSVVFNKKLEKKCFLTSAKCFYANRIASSRVAKSAFLWIFSPWVNGLTYCINYIWIEIFYILQMIKLW